MIRWVLLFIIFFSCCGRSSSDKGKASVEQVFEDSEGREYSLSEIERWDGVFLVISTTCGACYSYYEIANTMSDSPSNNLKYVALLLDPYSSLEEYKKGITYKRFGFLNENWIVFSSQELINELNEFYDLDRDGYPFLFSRKNSEIIQNVYKEKIN